MTDETKYKQELKDAGVDIPEITDNPAPEAPEAEEKPKEEETPKVEPPKDEPEAPKADLPDPGEEERKPRSIYKDYKETKSELKTEREAREQAEKERDELKAKLEAVADAPTPEKKQEAEDKFEAFAKKINADPSVIREMRELFISDIKPTSALSEEQVALLEEAKAAKEKQMFEAEFESVTPALKEYFPNATDEEMKAIKKELDTISHTKDWADKSLDYIAFKQKDKLASLVSPKSRGIEPKNPKDDQQVTSDFNPNADLSKMTAEQREAWYQTYQQIGKSEGLETDNNGRKILI